MRPHLVQRCSFKSGVTNSLATGFDSVASCDYMGSAEFEFGALPASLKVITANLYQYKIFRSPLKNKDGEELWFLCKAEDLAELEKVIVILANDSQREFSLKERMRLQQSLECSRTEKKYGYIDLWWDIGNHWMAGFGKDRMQLLKVGLEKLRQRWKQENKI